MSQLQYILIYHLISAPYTDSSKDISINSHSSNSSNVSSGVVLRKCKACYMTFCLSSLAWGTRSFTINHGLPFQHFQLLCVCFQMLCSFQPTCYQVPNLGASLTSWFFLYSISNPSANPDGFTSKIYAYIHPIWDYISCMVYWNTL